MKQHMLSGKGSRGWMEEEMIEKPTKKIKKTVKKIVRKIKKKN